MNAPLDATSLLRIRGHGHARVGYIELFFDLVFVFAITQLSHGLLHHLTPLGVVQTLLLFLAVWWIWIDTTWVMNWLDPERLPVRLLLFALMLGGLALSVAIPHAFGAAGLVFALAHVAIQLGRSFFMVRALRRAPPALYRNFRRILVWKALAAPLWLIGGLVDPNTRLVLWGLAVGIEYLGPVVRFWLPGLGASAVSDWRVEGGHMSERFGLFVIIALGESILITGATFSEAAWTAGSIAAFLVAFLGTLAMWWIYFDTGAERGARHMTATSDPGRVARAGYTYFHLLIGIGIILLAVADELVLAHPGGHAGTATVLTILGGSAAYLLGNALFKRLLLGWLPLSHQVGLGLLALLVPLSLLLSPLALYALSVLALVVVAGWERWSLRGRITP